MSNYFLDIETRGGERPYLGMGLGMPWLRTEEDHAVPEMTGDIEASLHARPSEIAKLASDADVRELVLSHNMSRSLAHLEENLAIIRKSFHGEIAVAEDLMCFELRHR